MSELTPAHLSSLNAAAFDFLRDLTPTWAPDLTWSLPPELWVDRVHDHVGGVE